MRGIPPPLIILLLLDAVMALTRMQHMHRHGTNNSWIYIRDSKEHKMNHRREKTRLVVFVLSLLEKSGRRHAQLKQFLKEKWLREEVVMLHVFGTKQGSHLETNSNYSSLLTETSIEAVGVPCRDSGDERNNENSTASSSGCKLFEALKFVHANFEAQYVWRIDSDAYLNIRHFFQWAETGLQGKDWWWLGNLRKVNQACFTGMELLPGWMLI
jgi:hypothetical protein